MVYFSYWNGLTLLTFAVVAAENWRSLSMVLKYINHCRNSGRGLASYNLVLFFKRGQLGYYWHRWICSSQQTFEAFLSFTTHPSSSTPVDGSVNQIFTLNLTSRRDKFLSGRLWSEPSLWTNTQNCAFWHAENRNHVILSFSSAGSFSQRNYLSTEHLESIGLSARYSFHLHRHVDGYFSASIID